MRLNVRILGLGIKTHSDSRNISINLPHVDYFIFVLVRRVIRWLNEEVVRNLYPEPFLP